MSDSNGPRKPHRQEIKVKQDIKSRKTKYESTTTRIMKHDPVNFLKKKKQ